MRRKVSRQDSRHFRMGAMGVVALIVLAVIPLGSTSQVDASTSPGPLLWLDATNPASYPGTGLAWTDLSSNNFDGTIVGGVTYNATTQAFQFPGGLNGQGGYVSLAGDMSNFDNGITIEFEGEFGAVRSNWERIFDFALNLDNQTGGIANIADAIWVGQFDNFNELTIEVFRNGTSAGYCYTTTNRTALGGVGDRSFNKWLITIDSTTVNSVTTHKCRIYKNGEQLRTRATTYGNRNFDPTSADQDGSTYQLPLNTSRPSIFLGRSNFSADRDLEGSIRYLRIYNSALSTEQAQQNASATVVFDANGGTGSMANQTSTSSAALTQNSFARYGYTFDGWNTDPNGNGVTYADGATYPFSSSTTLFAQWVVDPNAPATTVPAATTLPNSGPADSANSTTGSTSLSTTNASVRSTQLPSTGNNANNFWIALAGAVVVATGVGVRLRQKSNNA